MRCIVHATTKERGEALSALLEHEGHIVDLRFLGSLNPRFHTDEVRVIFLDRDLGALQVEGLCERFRANVDLAQAIVVLFGAPITVVDADRLTAAGVTLHVGELDDAFLSRLRFVEKLATRRPPSRNEREVTETRRAEESEAGGDEHAATIRAEEEIRRILEQISDGVLLHDLSTVHWVNRGWAHLAGFDDPGEVVGASLYSFMPARDRARVIDRQKQRRNVQPGAIPLSEGRLLRRDGVEVDIEFSGVPTTFKGRPAYLTVIRDITEKRRMTLELLAADRLTVLSSVAANVGHEINNSLVYVMANVRLAAHRRKTAGSEDDTTELLEDALEGTDRIAQIVSDLGFFRATEALGATDVHRVIDACLRMTHGRVRSRATVVREFQTVPKVRANDARLVQVLLNVLSNAAQSIPERDVGPHTITISTEVSGGRVLVRVKDTGIGIAPEHKKRLFEPFFTTRGDRGGTGLGLSIAKALLASQGGEITIESEVGRGTTVTLSLPAEVEVRETREASPDREAEPQTRRRVLVIDDEPFVARSIRDSLSRYDIDIASGAREAIQLIESSSYDAIVCDVMMPGMNGKDLYTELANRRRGEEERVVFMTGGAYTNDAASFVAELKNPCVEKPFRMAVLIAAIEGVARGAAPGLR